MQRTLKTIRDGRLMRAYKTLRTIAERHRAAGHEVDFTAVSEDLMVLQCRTCMAARLDIPVEPQ